jgi:N utilization substance protein B
MANSQLSRNKEQEQAMYALYDVLTYIDMKIEVNVQSIISNLNDGLPYEECPTFVKEVVLKAIKNYATIIDVLNSHMNKWSFDRLDRVEQAILMLAYTDFFFLDEKIDKKVVINVAIILAKSFLGPSDYKFVNAILDKVLTSEK